MGCGISRFGRNIIPEADDLSRSSASQSKTLPQPEYVKAVNSVKEKERLSTSAPTPGSEREELEKIKVNQPENKEDADDDDDNDKQGRVEADDSIFRYPRSPSFREYCTDPEIRFGIDSSTDNDDEDDDDEMDSRGTSRKLSKSTMSSPNTRDKAELNGEAATGEANDEGKGRASPFSATGQKTRSVFGNKFGRSGTQGRSLRSYFQVSSWHKPPYFTKSSTVTKDQ